MVVTEGFEREINYVMNPNGRDTSEEINKGVKSFMGFGRVWWKYIGNTTSMHYGTKEVIYHFMTIRL